MAGIAKQIPFYKAPFTEGKIFYTILGALLSAILVIPYFDFLVKLFFWAFLIISTVVILFLRNFYDDYRENQKYENIIDIYTQFVHTHFQKWVFKLDKDGNVDVITTHEIENSTDQKIQEYSIPILFYDIYDITNEKSYRPNIVSITIKDIPIDDANEYLHPEGILQKVSKGTDNDWCKNSSYEGLVWVKVPVELPPKQKIEFCVRYRQRHIYAKMADQEKAFAYITTPTGRLDIIVEPPEGKRISKVRPTKEIINKISEITDESEQLRTENPHFNNIAQWSVLKPKVGNKYAIVFKVLDATTKKE